jgi:hypothetical protein
VASRPPHLKRRHLRESWKIPSIDASPLPATAKRQTTHVDDNEGLERIVGAGQWRGSSWNVQVCSQKGICHIFAASMPRIYRTCTTSIATLFAASLPQIYRIFAAYITMLFSRIFAAHLPLVCRVYNNNDSRVFVA